VRDGYLSHMTPSLDLVNSDHTPERQWQ